jgi:hypothetical protein
VKRLDRAALPERPMINFQAMAQQDQQWQLSDAGCKQRVEPVPPTVWGFPLRSISPLRLFGAA